MNIEKIFNAVDDDEMNSPLAAVCAELELQGYKVKLEGLEVTGADIGNDLFIDLEKAVSEFNLELLKNSAPDQKFKLVFTDYHKLEIHQAN